MPQLPTQATNSSRCTAGSWHASSAWHIVILKLRCTPSPQPPAVWQNALHDPYNQEAITCDATGICGSSSTVATKHSTCMAWYSASAPAQHSNRRHHTLVTHTNCALIHRYNRQEVHMLGVPDRDIGVFGGQGIQHPRACKVTNHSHTPPTPTSLSHCRSASPRSASRNPPQL
jgi:hypothetical protein